MTIVFVNDLRAPRFIQYFVRYCIPRARVLSMFTWMAYTETNL
jgi:hypothetical protein